MTPLDVLATLTADAVRGDRMAAGLPIDDDLIDAVARSAAEHILAGRDAPRETMYALLGIAYRAGPVTISVEGGHSTHDVARVGDREWAGSWERDVAPALVAFDAALRRGEVPS